MSAISLSPTRRELLAATAAAGALQFSSRERHARRPASTGIRPFSVNFPQDDLDDLRRRIAATPGRSKRDGADTSQGVQLATMQKLAQLLGEDYDWRKVRGEAQRLPKFVTEIDGLDIHFIHVRSKHENALPMIVTHGWPGSIIEQLKIIGPLTNPTATAGRRRTPSTS